MADMMKYMYPFASFWPAAAAASGRAMALQIS
jgi:hypothetical protein